MSENLITTFWLIVFIGLTLLLVHLNTETKKQNVIRAQKCIESHGQWIPITNTDFTCLYFTPEKAPRKTK